MRCIATMLTLCCGVAVADGPSLSLAVLRLDYDARETGSNGVVLNREQGHLAGLQLEAGADVGGGRWTLQGQYAEGSPDYAGFSQIGLPLRTVTDLRLSSLGLQWAPMAGLPLQSATLRPWIGLLHRRIDRHIRPSRRSLALNEQLDLTLVQGALELNAPLGTAWTAQFQATLDWPLHQRLDVDTGGVYDALRLDLAARASYELRVRLAYKLTGGWQVALQLSYAELRIGSADARVLTRGGVPAGLADYPGSHQRLSGGGLVIAHSW